MWATACAGCHGQNGEGADIGGAIHDPAFLALSSDQVLRRYIITGRNDLSEHMPNFADTDGRDENFQTAHRRASHRSGRLVGPMARR